MYRRLPKESAGCPWWDIFDISCEEPKGDHAADEYFEKQQPKYQAKAAEESKAASADFEAAPDKYAFCYNYGSAFYGVNSALSQKEKELCQAMNPGDWIIGLEWNIDGTKKTAEQEEAKPTSKKGKKPKKASAQSPVRLPPIRRQGLGTYGWLAIGGAALLAFYLFTAKKRTK